MSTSQRELRFGVRAISGRRAATWHVSTPGDGRSDVYVACRELGGALKTSLHESGLWHTSFPKHVYDSGFANDAARPPKRFVDTWARPPDIAPGVTLACRIVVPSFALTAEADPSESDKIIWVAPAQAEHATTFLVIITSHAGSVDTWPGKRSMNSQLIGSFPIDSGETVWVVSVTEPFPTPEPRSGTISFFAGRGMRDLRSKNLRAVVFGSGPDGSCTMYDVCAGVTPRE